MTMAPPGNVALLVLAKEPRAGRVKTRLCPPFTPHQAAGLAAAALADTMAAVAATAGVHPVLVLDGDPRLCRPTGVEVQVLAQRGKGLAERLAAAFADGFAATGLPMLLIGMDTPQLVPALLRRAASSLLATGTDAVFGPAIDGGWWALGLRRPVPGLFHGVPMSSPVTAARQRDRLVSTGLRVLELPALRDVDTAADAVAVAAGAPTTRFAAALAGALTAAPAAAPPTAVPVSAG